MLAVLAMETAAAQRRRRYAGIMREPQETVLPPDEGDITQALRTMRGDALDRHASLVKQAIAVWSQDNELQVTMARDAEEAVRAIAAVSTGCRDVVINKSSVVRSELVPTLQAAGFRVIEAYYEQFPPFENRFTEYWQVPAMPVGYRRDSFQPSSDWATVRRSSVETHGAKDVIAVMGVNAASSSDGSVVLMQHGRNIGDIFTQAREVVLVIGLDKIVPDQAAAIFQAQGMALYGYGSLLLDLRYKESSGPSYDGLPFAIPPERAGRKIHIILLDNGRTQLMDSRYRQLLLCIDCRACARACPVGEIESRAGKPRRAPREYIYSRALHTNPSGRACLQCRRCEAICPVGIELPDLIAGAHWEAGTRLPGALADYMLRHPETLLRSASGLATVHNRLATVGPLRWLGEKAAGISKERELPRAQSTTFAERFRSSSGRSAAHTTQAPSEDTRGVTV